MHAACHRLLSHKRGFWVGMAFVLPFPLAFGAWWLGMRSKQARADPRKCPACKTLMRRLSEAEHDAHLSLGLQSEERVGSREHDVWRCPACSTIKIESYDTHRAAWAACPQCKAITLRQESSTPLEPTEEAQGKAGLTFVCMACNFKNVQILDLPRLKPDNGGSSSGSSSSSSSSSSSGDSCGWGSSGGDGSSASW